MAKYTEAQLRAALDGATSWRTVGRRLRRSPVASTRLLRELAARYGLDTSGIVNRSARTYTDQELADAVASCSSWTDVAVQLGKGRNAGASIARMRRAADRLGLNVSHLETRRRARTYTEGEVRTAIASATSWKQVCSRLGRSTSEIGLLRDLAVVYQIDVEHLRGVPRRLNYTDQELADAVASSTTWVGVAVTLGMAPTSGNAKMREAVARLGLDVTHFRRPRRRSWTDAELATAVKSSTSWSEVAARLGKTHRSIAPMRRAAAEIGLDVTHLGGKGRTRA